MEEVVGMDIFTAASIGQASIVGNVGTDEANSRNRSGWTPLMYAAYYGHDKLVGLLVSTKGADPAYRNLAGRSCLILASMCGNDHVVGVLLKLCGGRAAQMRIRDGKGWTALFHAAYLGHQNVVRILLENGDDPNAHDDGRRRFTPLMLACNEGHEIVAECLLGFGGDASARSSDGDTARSLARFGGNFKIVALLDGHARERLRDDKNLNVRHGPSTVARLLGPRNANNLRHSTFGPEKVTERPDDLLALLDGLGLGKYYETFAQQDVDLEVFLTLTDGDLKEIGISLLGPRRKMTSAIARWHAAAPSTRNALEGAYADKLEIELRQMAAQFRKAFGRVEELQKQVQQEKQLRYLVEGSLVDENAFVSLLNELCAKIRTPLESLEETRGKLEQSSPADASDGATDGESRQIANSANSCVKSVKAVVQEISALVERRMKNLEQKSNKQSHAT